MPEPTPTTSTLDVFASRLEAVLPLRVYRPVIAALTLGAAAVTAGREGAAAARASWQTRTHLNDIASPQTVLSGESPQPQTSNEDEFRYYAPTARKGILLIRSFSDTEVLDGVYNCSSSSFQRVITALGPDTNLSWITSQCAEEAYTRGLIDEVAFDCLTIHR